MKVLVYGSRGYLGSNIVKNFLKVEVISDSTTDISKFCQVVKSIERCKPDWVVNCAAAVDEDKSEQDITYWQKMINANLLGAINVLKACHTKDVKLAHIRTPFEKTPIDDYSLSKISAYKFISAEKYKDMILSVMGGWYFGGVNSRQFDKLLIRSIKEKFPLGITNNSYSSPTFISDFCFELEKLILKDKRGDFTISGSEKCTRYEFAKEIANFLGKTMEDFGWTENNNFKESARRPKDWSNNGNLPSYKERMKDFLKENELL